jgi:hypothetical protein
LFSQAWSLGQLSMAEITFTTPRDRTIDDRIICLIPALPASVQGQ